MADTSNAILSGEEVERLLESFHEGQQTVEQPVLIEDEGSVKYYDFKRPNTVSREKKRLLYKLFENTAYHMSRDISNYLRSSVKVTLDSIEELSFEIFKSTCPELIFINTIRMKPLKGFGGITTDLGLCLSIVEKAFGGSGKSQNDIRRLTDTEVAILGNLITIIVDKVNSSWEPVITMNWKVSETSMESRYFNIASDAEVVLLISFAANLEYSFGEIKLCIPVSSINSTLEQMCIVEKAEGLGEDNRGNTEQLGKLVNRLKVAVTGILDETNILVDDFVSLKEGDVIKLDSKITDDLKVAIEGKKKYYGKLGTLGKKKAIQITSLIDDEDDISSVKSVQAK